MIIEQTETFKKWLGHLKDTVARARIVRRIERMAHTDTPGDSKPVGEGVFELRFDFGPGYRVYYAFRNDELVLLLAGGDKSSQKADIKKSIKIWNSIKQQG